MFDLSNAVEQFRGDIFQYIDELELYSQYLHESNVKINTFYNSPFSKDRTPSFRLMQRGNNYIFKCFSTGKSGNIIHLISELEKINDYSKTIQFVANKLNIKSTTDYIKIQKQEYVKPENKLEVVVYDRYEYPKSFLQYWEEHGINEELLGFFDVKPCKQVWWNDFLIKTYKDSNICIRYRINGKYRIYNPLEKDKTNKWFGNLTEKEIYGWNQLPMTGDTLIISKAYKDVMVWKTIGIPSIAPSAERNIIKPNIIENLKKRFKKIIVCMDNDFTGIQVMLQYEELYQLETTMLPIDIGIKDIADLRKNCKKTKEFKQLINNYLNI